MLRVLGPDGKRRARDWLKGRDSTARKVSGLSDDTWDAVSHNALLTIAPLPLITSKGARGQSEHSCRSET